MGGWYCTRFFRVEFGAQLWYCDHMLSYGSMYSISGWALCTQVLLCNINTLTFNNNTIYIAVTAMSQAVPQWPSTSVHIVCIRELWGADPSRKVSTSLLLVSFPIEPKIELITIGTFVRWPSPVIGCVLTTWLAICKLKFKLDSHGAVSNRNWWSGQRLGWQVPGRSYHS